MRAHERTVHSNGDTRMFACKTCDKYFSTNSLLNRHTKTCRDKLRPFICDICGKSFARMQHLTRHKESSGHPADIPTLTPVGDLHSGMYSDGSSQFCTFPYYSEIAPVLPNPWNSESLSDSTDHLGMMQGVSLPDPTPSLPS
jgi:uncharacterized Zn-finger protein